MAQHQFAGFAVLVALAFMVMALSACSNFEHGPTNIAPIQPAAATPEFHGADIGGDALRGHLRSD